MEFKCLAEKIKVAIFDMDGTIADSLGFFEILWKAMGEKYFGDPTFKASPEVDKFIRTKTLKDACAILRAEYGVNDTDEGFFKFCDDMLSDFYKYDVKLKGRVIELLDFLKSKGIKMCVASATAPQWVRMNVDNLGISDYFEFIISCTEVGCGKEKPDVFIEAARRLGADVSEACVFEDSFIAIETAKRAGFMTVGVYDKNNYDQERLEASSDIYVSSSMGFEDLIKN